jgi:transposase-like protein
MYMPKTLKEAVQYYSNEQVCIDAIAELRWPDGRPVCPKCGAIQGERKHYWLDAQKRWKCFACRKQFSVKVDSVFEDSPLSLSIWLMALWMLCNCKNGVSSHEIARETGISQKAAWHLLHRLRFVLTSTDDAQFGGDGTICEADEAFIGGLEKNKHLDKRGNKPETIQIGPGEWKRLGKYQGPKGKKTSVMGILDRQARQVRAFVIPFVDRMTLQDAILDNVAKGSSVYTDAHKGYDGLLLQGYLHQFVNHVNEYVRGEVHTQGIENFWALLKRGLKGTYIAVEPFHLDRYVAEQCWRYNNRSTKDRTVTNADRFALALSQVAGKRLQWKTLTGKEDGADQPF